MASTAPPTGAHGSVIVLVGQSPSVVGEALDFFAKKYGVRPACVYLIPTKGTLKYAELAKLAILDKYYGQPPVGRIRIIPVDDIQSEEDFVKVFSHLSDVFREAVERCDGPVVASITGGRKTMSIAGALVFSHLGADVIDTRSDTADEDRALHSQIRKMFEEGFAPKDVFSANRDAIRSLIFRPADISYVLPRFRIDLRRSDGRLTDSLGWFGEEERV